MIGMTDEQVIKALEQCGNIIVSSCKDCPLHEKYNANCVRELTKDALDLIKRQQAEIERLQKIANPKCQQCVEQTRKNSFVEFAEMVKAKIHDSVYRYWNHGDGGYYLAEDVDEDIDDLVKELTEVSNGE